MTNMLELKKEEIKHLQTIAETVSEIAIHRENIKNAKLAIETQTSHHWDAYERLKRSLHKRSGRLSTPLGRLVELNGLTAQVSFLWEKDFHASTLGVEYYDREGAIVEKELVPIDGVALSCCEEETK